MKRIWFAVFIVLCVFFYAKEIAAAEDSAKRIPACSSNSDCMSRDGLIAQCENAASNNARCVYFDAKKINAIVITDKNCAFCITSPAEDRLKGIFPGINFKFIDYRKDDSKKIIKEYGINYLPAFLLPKAIKDTSAFHNIEAHIKDKGEYFIVNKDLSGEFILLDRKKMRSRVDVFFSLYDKNIKNVLGTLKNFCTDNDINLNIHILKETGRKYYMLTTTQREETERILASEALYPRKFWSYLTKRLDNINSTRWFDDMETSGIDYKKIKKLIHSGKMKTITDADSVLPRELGVMRGIVMLVDNRMIFRVYGIKKGDLEKITGYLQ